MFRFEQAGTANVAGTANAFVSLITRRRLVRGNRLRYLSKTSLGKLATAGGGYFARQWRRARRRGRTANCCVETRAMPPANKVTTSATEERRETRTYTVAVECEGGLVLYTHSLTHSRCVNVRRDKLTLVAKRVGRPRVVQLGRNPPLSAKANLPFTVEGENFPRAPSPRVRTLKTRMGARFHPPTKEKYSSDEEREKSA